jgi:hypothetical protein
LNIPLSGPFSLYTTSKGCQVEKPAFQGWARALERFLGQFLISSVKRALDYENQKRHHDNEDKHVIFTFFMSSFLRCLEIYEIYKVAFH